LSAARWRHVLLYLSIACIGARLQKHLHHVNAPQLRGKAEACFLVRFFDKFSF
jgi:hypothetical protein